MGGDSHIIFFLFLHENILWVLEVPCRCDSNKYHNIYFCGEIRKCQRFSVEKKILSGDEISQQTHNVDTTSIQRWFNINTLNQHWIDVVSTLCARWDYSMNTKIVKQHARFPSLLMGLDNHCRFFRHILKVRIFFPLRSKSFPFTVDLFKRGNLFSWEKKKHFPLENVPIPLN